MMSKHPVLVILLCAVLLIGALAANPVLTLAGDNPTHASAPPAPHQAGSEAVSPYQVEALFSSTGQGESRQADNGLLEEVFNANAESVFYGLSVFNQPSGNLVFASSLTSMYATRFDLNGLPVSGKIFTCATDHWYRGISETSDGGFLLTGVLNTTSQVGLVIKLNSDLSVQWARRVNSLDPVWAVGGLESVDGGFVFLVREDSGFGLVKLNADGSTAWQKRLLFTGSENQTDAYDLYETTYLDGEGDPHCGGYILLGAIQNSATSTDWDVALAAVNCTGTTLHWARRIGGSNWDGTVIEDEYLTPYSSNLVSIDENPGLNTQDATLAFVVSNMSFASSSSLLIFPFQVTGGTTLDSSPVIGQARLLDSPGADRVFGPWGGDHITSLTNGNLALGFRTTNDVTFQDNSLVYLEPDLDLAAEHQYRSRHAESVFGLAETPGGVVLTGYYYRYGLEREMAYLLDVTLAGTNVGTYFDEVDPNYAYTNIAPTITTQPFTIDNGTLTIENTTCSSANVAVTLNFPTDVYLPITVR